LTLKIGRLEVIARIHMRKTG